jgi:hypothetical protein
MNKVAKEIQQTVDQQAQFLGELSEGVFSAKRIPGKWSPKEILGHLIDSAQNNIQRFVRGQYEDTPKIVYAQDDWVRLQDYQHYEKVELIRLWVSINRHLCRILVAMDPANYEKKCNTGSTTEELHTLAFLAEDYRSHMIHHLNQLKERIKNANTLQ